ncbi:MAG: TetR/AcrR family transcriptional regulator [Ilumatobacteraceae bacterium]
MDASVVADPEAEPTVRRGRPRDESCTSAILSATIDLVAEVGIAGLTVGAVSARAGVGKATIYRRWSSKEALMLDAWMSFSPTMLVPDTGSLRSDLQALFVGIDRPLNDPTLQRVFPQMIAAAKINPEVREAYRTFVAERRRPVRTVLERAVERGELPPDTDLQLVGDMLIAPMIYRWLVTDGPVDDEFAARVIDTVLAGLSR